MSGELLTWNGSAWEPCLGDLSGCYPNPTVEGLLGGTWTPPASPALAAVECRYCGCDVLAGACDHCGAPRATVRERRLAGGAR